MNTHSTNKLVPFASLHKSSYIPTRQVRAIPRDFSSVGAQKLKREKPCEK